MDCKTARLLLDFARPQAAELEPSEREALEGHLSGCPDCEGMARVENRLDARLSAAMLAVPIPAGLRQRLHHRLEAERNLVHRRWLRRASAVAAGLAATFLAIWFVVARERTTTVNVQDFLNTQEYSTPVNLGQVEERVREEYGIAILAPPQFDYQLFRYARLTRVNDRPVVELVFFKPREGYVDEAHVFILLEPQFKIDNAGGGASGGRLFRAAELDNPVKKEVHYLVLFTGDSLEDFFLRVQNQPERGERISRRDRAVGMRLAMTVPLDL